jgi:hypothetical protein
VDVGNVPDELDPRTIGGEVPDHQIWHVLGGLRVSFGGDPERPWLASDQALIAHDLTNQLRRTLGFLVDKIGVNPPIPVGAVRGFEENVDLDPQRLSAGRGGRLRTRQPVIETRR